MTPSIASRAAVVHPLTGIALMVSATMMFSGHDTFAKYLSMTFALVMVVWVRYLVHTVLMGCLYIPQNGWGVLKPARPGLQILRALCLLGTSLFFTAGLKFMPLAETTAVHFLAPLILSALSIPLLKETVTKAQWATVMLGFSGVLLIVHPGGDLFTYAIFFPLGSATCFALYQILTKSVTPFDSPATSNFFAGLFNTILMTAIVPFYWKTPALADLFPMLGIGTCGMLGHLLMAKAYEQSSPGKLAPFGYCQIAGAIILGYFVFSQAPTGLAIVGIAAICMSGLLSFRLQRKQ